MKKRNYNIQAISTIFVISTPHVAIAQTDGEADKCDISDHITYMYEAQTSASSGKTPLWLNANKYGLSSLDEANGYVRVAMEKPLLTDSAHALGLGYGFDVALLGNYTSTVAIQQAFVEGRWLHGVLTVGSKYYPMELKNSQLSSGSQTLGINARPIPQVRLALPDYWTLPFAGRLFHIKGHIAYGKMTDDNWQHSFTGRTSKYSDDVLYHSKAGYIMVGKPEQPRSLTLEVGLEMATQFGGTNHEFINGTETIVKGNTGIGGFFKVLFPGGSDSPYQGTVYESVEGNTVGSWVGRLTYNHDTWSLEAYIDKFFEHHSAMFLLDYDGYGTGDEWNVKKDNKYLLYDFGDCLVGLELKLKNCTLLRGVVAEYITTKYQSGSIYHDRTESNQVHIGGKDNYYNHHIYPGWQHWGMVMGNPLYRSPIYNDDGQVNCQNNRFTAYHLGFNGSVTPCVDYRVLATYQEGWGTYNFPFNKKRTNTSVMVEAVYNHRHDWMITTALGMDTGRLIGNNFGLQLTFRKTGLWGKKKTE